MAGNAKLTKGYRLPARYIMHTVGPFSHGGQRGEKEPLASCYRRSLELVTANGIASISPVATDIPSNGLRGLPLPQFANLWRSSP